RGPLVVSALAAALTTIADRHEVLRSQFDTTDGEPHIRPAPPAPLHTIDLRHTPNPLEHATTTARQHAEQPFTLTHGPLYRTTLLHLDTNDHILLATFHHSIFDGWSIGVFQHELSTAYTAHLTNTPPPLPDLTIHYSDYAHWQHQRLTQPALHHQLTYWRNQLANAPEALQLPTDRPRPPIPTHRGGLITFHIDHTTTTALHHLATRNNATLYMAGLAAFHTLLARYTNTTDIITGSPAAGRTTTTLEPLIGFFVNTLPIRSNLTTNPTYTQLLHHIRDTTLDAHTNQDLPFDHLVEELAPTRDLSRNPIVQNWFDLFTPDTGLSLEGLRVEPFTVDSVTTRFDVELHCASGPTGLDCQLIYARDLFDHATMRRLATHYQQLLRSIISDPDQPCSRLNLIPPDELAHLTAPTTPTSRPRHQSVVDWFHHTVATHPDAIALTHHHEHLTYTHLNNRANHLAHHLIHHHHTTTEHTIAVCLPRGTDLITTTLAILKTGAAYLPIDPDQPTERTTHMLTTANTHLLITNTTHQPHLPTTTPHLNLDHHPTPHHHQPTTNPPTTITPHNLAYVIYTSGSTGQPKGVA
ncbi:condensation domain-containing protein, partial [Micromonospora rosaria]|uniref:condensation domain-containing protein n=1 Tax=Micromonospora rosaria TaxID=47874 RepID=UPI0037CC5803